MPSAAHSPPPAKTITGRESKEEIEAGAAAEGWAQWWSERWGTRWAQLSRWWSPRAPQEEIASLAAGHNLLEGVGSGRPHWTRSRGRLCDLLDDWATAVLVPDDR
jgi:hypothetical protein